MHHDATRLDEGTRPHLVQVLRVAFPHPDLPDGPYERTADSILAEAASSTWSRVAVAQGLSSLDTAAGGDFGSLPDADALALLRRVQSSTFFALVRRMAVLNLYDDAETWAALGYEGPSYAKGGYVDRGFADLDWLPEPRIETYDGPEPFVAFVPDRFSAGAPAAVDGAGGDGRDTSNQPGRREAQMQEVAK